MKNHGNAPKVVSGFEINRNFTEISVAVARALPAAVEGADVGLVQKYVEKPGLLVSPLRQIFIPSVVPTIPLADWHAGWPKFWRNHLQKHDLWLMDEGIGMPDCRDGFNWSIVIPAGLTPNKSFEICQSMFPSRKYIDNLDTFESCRQPGECGYTILVRDRVEADEENKNKSADDLGGKEKWQGFIGLSEREVLEAYYYVMTGLHLDSQNVTLCPGSRDSVGGVPVAGWGGGRFGVCWCAPDDASGGLRARSVVS